MEGTCQVGNLSLPRWFSLNRRLVGPWLLGSELCPRARVTPRSPGTPHGAGPAALSQAGTEMATLHAR